MHEGYSIENRKYFGIFSKILFDNTDNNTFDIETIKRDPMKLKLINEAYLLLFEKNEIAPRSTPSTPLHPHSPAESMEENHQETEATTDRQFEDRKCKFKLAVYKFMLHDKHNMQTECFKFEELKHSIFLSEYTEDEIKLWIKNTKQLFEDKERTYIFCSKEKVENICIFSNTLFDNTDKNTFDIETIKRDPKKLKLINEAYLLLFEKNLIAPGSTPSAPQGTH